MSKNILEIFSKYTPDADALEVLQASGGNTLKYDRELRIVEVELELFALAKKSTLYKIEAELCKVYGFSCAKILPKYSSDLLCYEYIPQILVETERIGAVARGFFSDYSYTFDNKKLIVDINAMQCGLDFVNDYRTNKTIEMIIFSEFGVHVSVEIICSDPRMGYSESLLREFEAIDNQLNAINKDYVPYKREEKAKKEEEANDSEETSPSYRRVTTLYSVPDKQVDEKDDDNLVFDSGCRRFDLSAPEYVYGEEFDVRPVQISRIKNPQHNIIVAGDVFDFKKEPTRAGDKFNISFSLTDYCSSIDVKCYGCEAQEADLIGSFAFDGATLALYGTVRRATTKDNKISEDLYFKFAHAAKIRPILREDNAKTKRVELHLHTAMSAMDALIQPPDVIKAAKRWGFRSIAITDHGNLQAYPEAMLAAEKQGIKVIYGLEAYFVNDTAGAVNGKGGGFDDEFVVFDIETTGLSNQNDRIIEIGAVRVAEGKVCETFGTYVDPERPISEEITKLTGITNQMVTGAPSQKQAVEDFMKFVGDRMLIAHNASFDMGFIRRVCTENDIPFDNSYLDTVALSRYLNPDLKNHKLDNVAKHYNLKEFNHHRAYDDASILAEIFICMVEKMRSSDINNFSELDKVMRDNADPLKLRPYHQIILVKNMTGLKNLYKIVSESYLRYYHRNPRVPKTLLEKHREGLIIGSACEAGELYSAIIDNLPSGEIEKIAEFYDYLEIQPIANNHFLVLEGKLKDDEALREINRKIYQLGKKLKKPVVATCDAHYLNPEDDIYRKILLSGMKFKDADKDSQLYLRTTEEMLEEFSYLGEQEAYEVVVTNTNLINDMVEEVRPIPKGTYTPSMDGAEQELQDRCWSRAKELYGDPLPELVSKRLDKELTSIINNGFAVLYIIAERLVKYSESQGYLVGSRGSVGSSFVASMAGISEVNPLPPHYYCPKCKNSEFILDKSYGSGFDLPDKNCPVCGTKYNADGHDIPFETFLGFYGDKSPDIDLNFSGDVQGKVHKYTEELFGAENVFRAGTLGTLANKTAYGFVAKYLEDRKISLPKPEMNRLTLGCVGVKRTTGQHPGGIIVIPREYDVYDFTPVQHPADDPKSSIVTTHFAFSYLHDTVLKLDELGHDIPTKYKWLERFSNTSVMDVKMNDKDVYELFQSTAPLGVSPEDIDTNIGTFGIPEFGTRFAIRMLEDAKPKNFADLLQISGLSHGTDVWTGNAQDLIKQGICDISHVIGCRDNIMNDLIAWGVENALAFKIMEAVRKGKGLTPEWEAEMRSHGVPEWYIGSCKKIKYMFPKAHAAAYVMSAIRLGWYKVHMPQAFYCAMFTVAPGGFDAEIVMKGKRFVMSTFKEIEAKGRDATQKESSMISALQLANECYARGIRFLGVDLERSDAYAFLPEAGGIRLPFLSLNGLGESAALKIVEERKKERFFSVEDLRTRAGLTKSVIEILRRNGVLDELNETDQLTFMI